jgi:hypothetical protein
MENGNSQVAAVACVDTVVVDVNEVTHAKGLSLSSVNMLCTLSERSEALSYLAEGQEDRALYFGPLGSSSSRRERRIEDEF